MSYLVLIVLNLPQTSAALETFFLAMTMYPAVFRCARDELDSVVGTDRLPTFADRSSLPYFGALVKETLRWQNVGPICERSPLSRASRSA